MGECTDKRFQQMLHPYELGILPPDQAEAFELHLYECDACVENVRQFKEASLVIRHDLDVREAVKLAVGADETADSSLVADRATVPGWARVRRVAIPTMVLTAAAVIVLILWPWHIEVSPLKEAEAVENRLAIMYFDNAVDRNDPDKLGEVAANLLITDLAESRYMQVVPGQRIRDILRQLEREGAAVSGHVSALSVGEKANARWILTGTILQVEPTMVISTELIDVASHTAIASAEITGAPDETVFAVVDRLSARVRSDLSLPTAAHNERDPSVADVTTHSPEAYRYYLEGVDYYMQFYTNEARTSFEKALSYDSTYAMAYYYLSMAKDKRLIDSALKYSDHIGQKDRLYILSQYASGRGDTDLAIAELERIVEAFPDEKYALYRIGNYKHYESKYAEAVTYLNRAIAIDSCFKLAYNFLSYTYDKMGDFDHALWAINKYIELVPEEANPYDSRGDLLAAHGRLADAMESYRTALAKKPDFQASQANLARMCLFSHDFDRAESLYTAWADRPDPRFKQAGLFFLSVVELYRGKVRQALTLLDRAVTADGAMSADSTPLYIFEKQAMLRADLGDFDGALAIISRLLEDERRSNKKETTMLVGAQALILTDAGKLDEAKAAVDRLAVLFKEDKASPENLGFAAGYLSMAMGNLDGAIMKLEETAKQSPKSPAQYWLARAYLKAGLSDKAAAKLEEQLGVYNDGWRWCDGDWSISMHYYLGTAYENLGRRDRAIEQYKTFLGLWKDADPEIMAQYDARQRLARLESTP